MTTLPVPTVLNSVVVLLTEAYAGPPDPSSTWFIDNEPDSGVFGHLANVTFKEASVSVDGSNESGTTIASHAEHLRWSLAMMNAAIRGEPLGDWKESWLLLTVDDERWEALRGDLRAEFEKVCQAIQSQVELPEEYLIGVLALLPHAAYHLGTIRQMIERVRS
jgi:hypothetical protein